MRFGSRWVLRGADLAIGAGERVCIVGPNGAGKSTLLRCLTGVLQPTEGTIEMDGAPVTGTDRRRLARRLAVVGGDGQLPFAMTVEEMVALGRIPWLHPWQGPTATDDAAVVGAMVRTGILDMRTRDVRTLSLGERQLVRIAMALAQGGRILVLDEPTVHLDLRHQVATMELLARLSDEEGMTVLAVLHDLALARESFPRMVLVDQGRLLADGPPASVLAPDRVREVYGVDPRYVTPAVGRMGALQAG
ncbi:MAG: ABC transporter ATP-binding protein [Chloroflexi bacterium]|nr:ABC transporter ATP-binding protein [Chloroflexota bacterium]